MHLFTKFPFLVFQKLQTLIFHVTQLNYRNNNRRAPPVPVTRFVVRKQQLTSNSDFKSKTLILQTFKNFS